VRENSRQEPKVALCDLWHNVRPDIPFGSTWIAIGRLEKIVGNIGKIMGASLLAIALAASGTAMARGGGFHGGGFHGGFHSFRGGFRGVGGFGVWGYPGWWGYDYAYGYPSYYDYPAYAPYDYPPGVSYAPDAPPPANASARRLSPYCVSPARVCLLHRPANVGAACSCRVENGYSHGRVVPQ
jgi:hypothetical protein